MRPSFIIAAAESAWNALIPRITVIDLKCVFEETTDGRCQR
jgi:hypothetical protein